MAHPNQLAALKKYGPKPGEVRNPEGRNQWTHRREAIQHMEDRAKRDSKTFHDLVWDDALAGNYLAIKLLWEDLHPRTEKLDHRIEVATRSHEFLPDDADQRALTNEIKGNGKALQ